MTVYLLDTDICVAYLRQRPALLVQRINMRPPADLRICSVVKAELLLGTYQSQRPQQNLAKVNAFA
ncbi:MAG TPA: type II toxin-antitoxin system VapC family toxin, partial [Gemmataceae bacterium]|nr:type II toxin-antitoxin system VapC family toxin [Gemmataceae bacterium]